MGRGDPRAVEDTCAGACASAPRLQRLTADIRQAIHEQRYPEFVQRYVARQFPAGDYPDWVMEGCRLAGIALPAGGAGGQQPRGQEQERGQQQGGQVAAEVQQNGRQRQV